MFYFQIISMTGVLCFLFAVYETFEYMCCYKDEKKEQSKLWKLLKRAHRLARDHIYNQPKPTEASGLLGENIPMQTFQATDLTSSGSTNAQNNSNLQSRSQNINSIPERSSGSSKGQVERSDDDDSLLHDVDVHDCQTEEDAGISKNFRTDNYEVNTSESSVIPNGNGWRPLLNDTGAKGQGHSISDKLTAFQEKVMGKKVTRNGYSLLQNNSDESETEF